MNQKAVRFYLLISALVVSLGFVFLGNAAAAEFSDKYASKVTVEKHIEERLLSALKRIGGTDKIIVIVNADVETDIKKIEKRRREAQQTMKKEKPRLVLPGVPVKKSIGTDRGSEIKVNELIPSVINKLIVTVLVDSTMSTAILDVMRDVAISVVGYNPDRGDMLNFRQIEFKKKQFEMVTLFHPPYVYWFMLFVFGGILLVAVSILLSNPFKQIASAVEGISLGGESSSDIHSQDTHNSPQADIQIPSAELPAMESLDGDTQMPFSFLQNKHIRELAFLLKDSPPEELAIVASYLAPEMATKLLESFSEKMQAEVALNLSGEGEVKLKEVKELERSIKERLNYIVGGDDKLASIFDFTGEDIRKRIFDIMASTDAEAVSRLMEKVKSFKVVMRSLPPHGIQALFRQIDPNVLARVLKSSPGDIQSQVLESLSEGAAERLREEMELSRPFSKERLKQERVNIISLVRRMSKAGLLEDMS